MADQPNARPVSGEIMTPCRPGTQRGLSSTDIVDADYEVLPGQRAAFRPEIEATPQTIERASAAPSLEGMAMLRPVGAPTPFSVRGGALFWTGGVAAALAAFWISGGHALVRSSPPFPGTKLSITAVNSHVDASGNRPVLFVDGEAGNDGSVTATLPPLEIRVTGEDGAVTRYRLGTSGRALGPGQRFAFSSRFEVQGNGVAAVAVSFVE